MNKFNIYFSNFLNYSLRILFLIVLLGSFSYLVLNGYLDNISSKTVITTGVFLGVTLLLLAATAYALKKQYNKYLIVTGILIVGFIIRVLWLYNIDSIPIGDFNRMFICAGQFLDGETYMFKETAYMARFPHMSVTVLYFAMMRNLFTNSLVAIKVVNIFLSMLNVVLLYLISNEMFENKRVSIWVLLFSALYPPMIIYNNVFCSENLAIPLFLISILGVLKVYNLRSKDYKKSFLFLIISGLFLGFTQLFRPIGYVAIIAYVMFIAIYFKEKIRIKISMISSIIISFILPFAIVSYVLIGLKITENPLWKGTEPMSISMLKGSNIESGGRWNEEDAKVFDEYGRDYDRVDKAAKKIIKERLTTTPLKDLGVFYTRKYIMQWRTGDFGGAYWSEIGLDEGYNRDEYLSMLGKSEGKMILRLSEDGFYFIQLFYVILLLLSYIGLYKNRKDRNFKIDLLYILYGGFSMQCLLTESQDRYTYPMAWIFILLAVTAFNYKNKENGVAI